MKHTYGGEFSGLYFMCSLYIDGCDWFPSSAAGASAADASAAGTSESGVHTSKELLENERRSLMRGELGEVPPML